MGKKYVFIMLLIFDKKENKVGTEPGVESPPPFFGTLFLPAPLVTFSIHLYTLYNNNYIIY